MKVFSEWFGTKQLANAAGSRLSRRFGYSFDVRFAMSADGSHDWLLEVFE